MDSELVVAKARNFIEQRHTSANKVHFIKMCDNGCFRILEGYVEFKRALLFSTERDFKIKVNRSTGIVASYEEFHSSNHKR